MVNDEHGHRLSVPLTLYCLGIELHEILIDPTLKLNSPSFASDNPFCISLSENSLELDAKLMLLNGYVRLRVHPTSEPTRKATSTSSLLS